MKKLLTLCSFLVLLAPQLALAGACTSLTDNLAAYYKMDGNSNDSSHSNNGVDTSVTYSTTNAVINQAGQFGASSQVLIPSGTNFTGTTTGLTLAGWFYVTAATVSGTIIAKSTVAALNGQYLRLDVNSAKLNATPDGDTAIAINGATTLSINTRYFAAITYDGANVNLYLGAGGTVGTDAAQQAFTGATTPSTGSVAIGALGDFAGKQYFTGGAIDAVGYWTCGMTAAQITSLYNSGNGLQYPFTVANPATFTFWQFTDF